MNLAFRILIFIGYTIVYFFLALMATGGGHGNFIFFIAPISTWICPFIAICLTNNLSNKTVQLFFVILLLVHYLVIGISFYDYFQVEFWEKDFKHFSIEGYIFMFAAYLSGQLYIWSFWLTKNNSIKEEENIYLHLSE